MIRLYASSSAFMFGRLAICSSYASCPRFVLLQSKGIRPGSIPVKYSRLGLHNEDRYEREALDPETHPTVEYIREHSIEVDLGSDVVLRGRMDFLCTDTVSGNKYVIENKSADSKRTLYAVIRKGDPKTDNLAQLVTYMGAVGAVKGFLVYSFYTNTDSAAETPILKEERSFEIVLADNGDIMIDGSPSGYSMHERIAHMKACVEAVSQDVIRDRPDNWDSKWASTCTWCPFKLTCDKYDNGDIDSTVEFVDSAKQQLLKEQSV